MIQLVPMNEDQYDAFMELSARDQMEGHVREGRWKAEEAEANMARLTAQFLPVGLATPNHFFHAIQDSSGTDVGGLWYMLVEEEDTPQFFVMDIQIYEAFRRRGYGTQALRVMEDNAREMGVARVALHVFADNHRARAMYRKLGYAGADTQMVKAIAWVEGSR
jgi:RimJ/RimL family protein N-acetyltransferase